MQKELKTLTFKELTKDDDVIYLLNMIRSGEYSREIIVSTVNHLVTTGKLLFVSPKPLVIEDKKFWTRQYLYDYFYTAVSAKTSDTFLHLDEIVRYIYKKEERKKIIGAIAGTVLMYLPVIVFLFWPRRNSSEIE
jgi:hypothetical protein